MMYPGVLPHPDYLERYDHLVPGTAAKLIQLAEDEAQHRRRMEELSVHAQIETKRRSQQISERAAHALASSILLGRLAGFLMALVCIAACFYLALQGHTAVAIALTAIPSAAVIRAFLNGKHNPPDRHDIH